MWRLGRILRGMAFYVFCAALLCSALCSCSIFSPTCPPPKVTKIQPPPPPPPHRKSNLPFTTVDFNIPLSQITTPVIYVFKSQRRLFLVQGTTLVREYPCALGPNPKGTKYFQGDGRTPEGKFQICHRNPYSRFYKSLGLSYPTVQEAQNALSHGVISFAQYCSIKAADNADRLPPSNTALGGQVFIHGGGCHPDWTLGCIAIDNSDMDELFKVAGVGTPVYVKP
ncbi:MAG: L,D-transpeptidase [Syntrophobacteraceae bacterium]|nr:L,D-transpeptidase [Syntrophobacteraceae bacterium]